MPTTTTHPTRTIHARVTCVLLNDDQSEPTYEITVEAAPYKSWRFDVADATPYPVGSLLELTVPA